MPSHRDWNAISDRTAAMLAQKGEPFAQGVVVRRDLRKRLVWVEGFGAEPIPMMDFNIDIYVYDEWRETDIKRDVLTGSGNFTPSLQAAFITVEAVGPGGGGAGSSSVGGGMGGGAGGYAKKRISKPLAGWPVNYPYVCGAAGSGGATSSSGNDGTAATTFGSPATVTANPGTGGKATNDNTGGVGGNATGGDLNLGGGDGAVGAYVISGGVLVGGGGSGGSSRLGNGGRGGNQGQGRGGRLYGGGGGGGGRTDSGNNNAGGSGADGGIVVEQFLAKTVVKKKLITGTPRVPEIGDLVLLAQHLGSRELPKCIGVLQSFGFAGYDAGLE